MRPSTTIPLRSLIAFTILLMLGWSAPLAGAQSPTVLADQSAVAADEDPVFISLEEALSRVAEEHNVTFLYQHEALDDFRVRSRKALPARLTGQLDRLLHPHELSYEQVGERSYAIVPQSERAAPVRASAPQQQTGAIEGTVTETDGSPLPGVQVVLRGTPRGTTTDADGAYRLEGIDPGTYTVRATFVGFAPAQAEVTVAADETVEQNFELREDVMQMEGAVVTGTRQERTQRETTSSISVIQGDDIQRIEPNSQADILRSVPGVHTEGGGGEVAANVFVRGLPAPGQFKYNPIQEDGMPVISETRTTTSSQDIYFRNDLNVQQLEFVRGGSAALFGVGSPAGLINYISKTGGSTQETTLRTQVGQDNLYRLDFNTNGPLGENLRYNIGGFYRYDEGPVVSGLPTQGLQLKGNLTYLQDNGYIRIYAKYIDDSSQFFLPFPHDRDTGEAAAGNDGREITTVNARGAADFSFRSPDGVFQSQMDRGIVTNGASVTFEFVQELGDGYDLESRVRWTDMQHQFNIFIPFPAFQDPFEYADQFITAPTQQAVWRYANSTESFNPGTPGSPNFVIDQGAWNWDRPYTDFSTDVQLSRTFSSGNTTQNVTVGGFLSRTEVTQRDTHSSVLSEFADQPRLIDLFIEDTATGEETRVTQNGLSNAASVYVNNEFASNKAAVYAGNEITVGDDLRIDIGARYELRQAEIVSEGSEAVGADGAFGDALAVQGFQWGNSQFTRRSVRSTDAAFSLGLNYALSDVFNLYGVGSRGYFFPELASLAPLVAPDAEIGDLDNEEFWQGEFGVKAGSPNVSGTLAFYYTELNNRFSADPRLNPNTGVVEIVPEQIGGSRTLGVELTGAIVPPFAEGFQINGMVTVQDHEFTDFGDNTGNWIQRQPKFMTQGELVYDRAGFDASVSAKYTGKRFADEGNFQELEGYTIVNAGLGYTVGFADSQSLRFGLRAFNALNSRGLTEGDPRLPAGVDPSESPFFNARPILPRRITASLTYRL
ncbi:MAG: TonB-dependent receptor [Longimonas sp.]|uniref:TonB-dependent receptor n=1 Tax=Longimonas sp. TaxID=2039626 RepID=UPI00335A7CBA